MMRVNYKQLSAPSELLDWLIQSIRHVSESSLFRLRWTSSPMHLLHSKVYCVNIVIIV